MNHWAEKRRKELHGGDVNGVIQAIQKLSLSTEHEKEVTVIGQRLKQSGMHWTVKGANNIIALRCCFLSNRWEDFWETRSCA